MPSITRLLLVTLISLTALTLTAAQEDEVAAPGYTTTAHSQSGNRLVTGQGTFPDVVMSDVPLTSLPVWIVGAFVGDQPVWVVADEDGALFGSYELDGAYTLSPPLAERLAPGMPPLMVSDDFGSFVDTAFPADMAPLTSPARVPGRLVYVDQGGRLTLLDDAENTLLAQHEIGAAADVRVVVNNAGLAAVYGSATDERYVHGIMGDNLEHTTLVIMDMGFGAITATVELPGDQVFEGMSPFWADVDQDGESDLVVTLAAGGEGAWIRAYRADGTVLAEGPSIGLSNRWRHQLAWGAFGADGEYLLAEVLTPHIGGIVGFWRYDADSGTFTRAARREGFTSHVINSPNLDMAVSGDFNGDGQIELVLPDQALITINGLQLNENGEVETVWTLPVDGAVLTNLSAVSLPGGGLALAVGVVGQDGQPRLRVWR